MLLILLTTAALFTPLNQTPEQAAQSCITMNTDKLPLATRKSPLDSLSFALGKANVKVCFGRPSARGRTMLGGSSVPYGKLWRTGANEPTMIHTSIPLVIAGVAVPAGSYSIYTIPGEKEWHVIVNKSISQWGHESYYTPEVEAQEVGHGIVPRSSLATPVDTFTIKAEPASGGKVTLVLEWEKTRVAIPIAAGK